MTFVPLYTTWVALPGMLTGALAELIGQVVRRLLSLSQLLKVRIIDHNSPFISDNFFLYLSIVFNLILGI